jgi:type IV pilus assembly protein PilB
MQALDEALMNENAKKSKTKQPRETKKLKIGNLLVSEGYLTRTQLKEALAHQKKARNYLPLGQICIELGLLSETQLALILRTYKYKLYIGELLVNMALITSDQLDLALKEQNTREKKLGVVLIELGFISEDQLVEGLSIQLSIPKIIPDINLIDSDLAQQVSEAFLRKVEAVPAFKEGNVVTVIMADPLVLDTIENLKAIYRTEIQPAIAARTGIHELLDKIFQKIEFGSSASLSDHRRKDLIIGNVDNTSDRVDVVNIVDYIISSGVAEGASDIHIEPFAGRLRVRYRVDGVLFHKTDLPKDLTAPITSRIKALCSLDIAEKRRHQDGRLEARILGKDIDLRISVYASIHGETVVIRILHRATTLIDLDKLGFAPTTFAKFKELLETPSGLILVTGPTGSGKTTTLYASLNHLNNFCQKIITVEDPVEYTIDGVIQGKIESKLNLTYEDFLKSMMRQDPDIIMVGEIRDRVAAEATIQAALTGHKVFTTFHTDDTTGALLRLMDMGVETFLISSTVVSVLAQRLPRTLCLHCKEPYVPQQESFVPFSIREVDPSKFAFHRAPGCVQCNKTGFKGRTAIQELLVVNDAIRNAILSRKTSDQIRNIAREETGMVSMREDGFCKAAKGITSLEEVIRVTNNNETDIETSRTADEIVAILEGGYDVVEIDPRAGLPRPTASRPSAEPFQGPSPEAVLRKQV